MRPQSPETGTGDAACRCDGVGGRAAQRDGHAAGRGDVSAAGQRLLGTGWTGNGRRRVRACWCATRTTSWCSAGTGRKRSGPCPCCATCWVSSDWSSRRRRRASCTCGREARGFDFLGFEHRWVRATRNKNIQFLARWPSRRAMQRARDRVRELTTRSRLLLSPSTVVADVNRYLRGWVSYFRYGNSARAFDVLHWYAGWHLVCWWGEAAALGSFDAIAPTRFPLPTIWGSSGSLGASLRHGLIGRGGERRMPPGEGHR